MTALAKSPLCVPHVSIVALLLMCVCHWKFLEVLFATGWIEAIMTALAKSPLCVPGVSIVALLSMCGLASSFSPSSGGHFVKI